MTEIEEAIEIIETMIVEGCKRDGNPDMREALEYARSALREKQAAQQTAPLTLEELRGMNGEPVYISGLDVWVLVNMDTESPVFVFRDGGKVAAEDCYEVDYIAYRRPPKQLA